MSRAAPVPDVRAATKTEPREETHTRRVPPYNVILENDDHHSMEFVIAVLGKALIEGRFALDEALRMTRAC